MCGILLNVNVVVEENEASVAPTNDNVNNNNNDTHLCHPNLSRRGPDHVGRVHYCAVAHHTVELYASVLKMRSHSTLQPVALSLPVLPRVAAAAAQLPSQPQQQQQQEKHSSKMYLCWNGEVYQRMISNNDDTTTTAWEIETVAGYNVDDTQLVAEMLHEMHTRQQQQQIVSNDVDGGVTTSAAEVTLFDALFYKDYAASVAHVMGQLINAEYAFCFVTPWAVYYGRDPQGRRSLLYYDGGEKEDKDTPAPVSFCSWKLASVAESLVEGEEKLNINNNNCRQTVWQEVVPGLVHEYRFATGQTYTTPIPVFPPSNVEHRQEQASYDNMLPHPIPLPCTMMDVTPSMWRASLLLEHYLRQAVQLRVSGTIATNDGSSLASSSDKLFGASSLTNNNKIAVLFSGGIDSVVLAALTLQLLPPHEPLRLWNVSFVDQHSTHDTATTTKTTTTKSQDCVAAQASYLELRALFPHHTIQLETTEVSWEEMTRWEHHVRTLLHPKTTTMDLNIAMALWFASRGRNSNQDATSTTTTATTATSEPRILLVGMGADEQLGGYGRHRKAFEQGSKRSSDKNLDNNYSDISSTTTICMANQLLRQELNLDIQRLWERNLGRDDRVFSDHGKEARFPYLDYHVMNFLAQTPLQDICDFSLPPGQGDKRILRILAMRLGLQTASAMVKRAIQFGSRIAHVSDKRRFGSRRKAQGTATV